MLRTSLVSAAGNVLKILMPCLLCIGLGACGGGSDNDTATLTTAPGTATATPSILAASTTITIPTPSLLATRFNNITAIASDGTKIYFGTISGQLFRMSKTGIDLRNIANVSGFIGAMKISILTAILALT